MVSPRSSTAWIAVGVIFTVAFAAPVKLHWLVPLNSIARVWFTLSAVAAFPVSGPTNEEAVILPAFTSPTNLVPPFTSKSPIVALSI